jgi:hypothetical protein
MTAVHDLVAEQGYLQVYGAGCTPPQFSTEGSARYKQGGLATGHHALWRELWARHVNDTDSAKKRRLPPCGERERVGQGTYKGGGKEKDHPVAGEPGDN